MGLSRLVESCVREFWSQSMGKRIHTCVNVASTHMQAHMDYEVAGGEAMGSHGNHIYVLV